MYQWMTFCATWAALSLALMVYNLKSAHENAAHKAAVHAFFLVIALYFLAKQLIA